MITIASPLSSRLLAYTKERFPLIPVMILVFLMTAGSARLNAGFFGINFHWGKPDFWISSFTIFLFMLQLRMSDEIKDYDKDKIAYPERLLSQGIVNLGHIRVVLYAVVIIQFLLNMYLGVAHLIMLVLLQLYGYLMAKEFFMKEFLEPRIGLYLLTHQIILLPIMVYSAMCFVPLEAFFLDVRIFLPLLYLCLPYTVYELSRKTWSPDRENVHADSYTRFWGISKTILVEMILVVCIAALMHQLSFMLPLLHRMLAAVLFFIYFGVLFAFKKNPVRKKSKMVELGGSVLLLGIYALCAFAVY